MSSNLAVARAVARRSLIHAFKNPALLLPSLIFPLVFLVAFAGGLSAVGDIPGFSFPAGYTAFQFVFVLLQSAAFGGFFGAIGVASDFETGFAKRILLGASQRTGMIMGYGAASVIRYVATATLVTVAALIGGLDVQGSAVDLVGLYGLALLVNLGVALFAVGVFIRTKSVQAAPALQTPVFLTLFLAPVYVPLGLLTGWINTVASLNPATALLEAGRGFIAGEPAKVLLAFAIAVGLTVLSALFAVRSLRRAEAGA